MDEYDEQLVFEMGYDKGFKDGIKGSISKDQYEARLKADMVAMLTEIQLEIEENSYSIAYNHAKHSLEQGMTLDKINTIIQDKINALRGNEND